LISDLELTKIREKKLYKKNKWLVRKILIFPLSLFPDTKNSTLSIVTGFLEPKKLFNSSIDT
jgi:hypothetical protein